MIHKVEILEQAGRSVLGEGPLWDAEKQILYWVDIAANDICWLEAKSGLVERWNAGLAVSALGLRNGGGLVLATDRGFAFWSQQQGLSSFIGDPEAGRENARFNDGAVDPHGRFWAGSMAEDVMPTSALYRLDADLSIRRMVGGIQIANGPVWSPDGSRLYFADTPLRTIFVWDYDVATGAISNRRHWVQLDQDDGYPDGMTIDVNGYVWCAIWDGWRIARFDPTGAPAGDIVLQVQRPTSCTFGGAALDEMYITSASLALTDEERAAQPYAGALMRTRPGVRGLPAPKFKG